MNTETQTPEAPALPKPDPKLIAELFAMDPLKLSDQDLDVIIQTLREDRSNFINNVKAAPAKGKAKASAQAVLPLEGISLSDLGLD